VKNRILVSVAMPNEKDLEIMNESLKTLRSFGIPCEARVLSAHRFPEEMIEFAKNARERGIEVIIATASGAAHLPGMIAAFTTLPVIAVPLRSSFLDGLDSVLSMLQMPRGVPVATVSINGATNAAILACQILSLHSVDIKDQLDRFKLSLTEQVKKEAANVGSDTSII
jgi:5-(carboxyamino)imidazole ribonucleotide mutase